MNLFDRAIGYVSPTTALRRHAARQALGISAAAGGGYDGASSTRRQGQGWTVRPGSPDADTLPDLEALRARSRDLARNAPLAGGAIKTTTSNVVGTGLRLRAQIDRDVLKMTDDQIDEWETRAEAEFALWSSRECDLSRVQPFAELQATSFRGVLESGDVFVLPVYVERPGSLYALKLQLVEADRCSNPNRGQDKDELRAGVEVDPATGAPVAFHFANRHPGDRLRQPDKWDRRAAFTPDGLPAVLHLFDRFRPDQIRGVPYLAGVIEPFKQLARYSEAELMAAVMNACLAIVTKTEGGAPVMSPLAGQPSTPSPNGSDLGRVDVDFNPGLVIDGLKTNESVASFASTRPNEAFDAFTTAVLRQVGVELQLPFEVLVKHFTSSYSAARAALLDVWRFFRARRVWHARSLCQPVYELFLWEAVARGRLQAPGFFADPLIRQAWCGAKWIGDAPGQIDPTKETAAMKAQVEVAAMTLDDMTSQLTGGDWEDNVRQRTREVKLLKAAGLAPVAPANGVRPAAPPPPANPDKDPPDDPNDPDQSDRKPEEGDARP